MRSELTLLTTKKTGFLKSIPAILSFYENEILITTISKEKQKELQEEAKQEAKEEGKGKIKTMFKAAGALKAYADKVEYMKKEEIMQEATEVINKEDIEKIKFSKADRRYDPDMNQSTNIDGNVVIKLDKTKIKFMHKYEDNNNKIKKYIKEWK